MKGKRNSCNVTQVTCLTVCLLAVVPLCSAGVDSSAQQLLTAAARQVNIFTADAAPFQLDADFIAQIQVPTEGHLILRWDSKDRSWRRIINGDFEQIDIKKGEVVYLKRNAPFTPIRVREVIGLLPVLGKLEGMQIKKARSRTERGVQATCVKVSLDNGRGERFHEICIEPNSHDVLSDEWDEPPDQPRREEFSDYAEFRGHRYPHKIILLVNGSKVVEVHVSTLETRGPIDDALLAAPPGAIVRRVCDGMKRPVPVKTPDPLYPKSSSQNQLMGDTTVAMTVLPDGSADNIQLIGSGTHAMDDATLQTLKSWKFKPAMCGSESVTVDIEVVVSFRLR